jgi:hypothetical protein
MQHQGWRHNAKGERHSKAGLLKSLGAKPAELMAQRTTVLAGLTFSLG